EVGVKRKLGRLCQEPGMSYRLIAGDVAVEPTKGCSEATARGGKRLESHPREQPRRAEIPRIGKQQWSLRRVQLQKPAGNVATVTHRAVLLMIDRGRNPDTSQSLTNGWQAARRQLCAQIC